MQEEIIVQKYSFENDLRKYRFMKDYILIGIKYTFQEICEIRKNIIFDKNNCSGVYEIKNKKTNFSYIGYSKKIYTKWNDIVKKFNKNKKNSEILSKDFLIYGIESFEFSVLEYCDQNKSLYFKLNNIFNKLGNLYNKTDYYSINYKILYCIQKYFIKQNILFYNSKNDTEFNYNISFEIGNDQFYISLIETEFENIDETIKYSKNIFYIEFNINSNIKNLLKKFEKILNKKSCINYLYNKSTINYEDYLKTEKWKLISNICRKNSKFKCFICGSGGQLTVHHLTYERLGNENYNDLMCLCRDCHEKVHCIDY